MAYYSYSLLGGVRALAPPISYDGRLAFKSKTNLLKLPSKQNSV
jgi:hypothetical protein